MDFVGCTVKQDTVGHHVAIEDLEKVESHVVLREGLPMTSARSTEAPATVCLCVIVLALITIGAVGLAYPCRVFPHEDKCVAVLLSKQRL